LFAEDELEVGIVEEEIVLSLLRSSRGKRGVGKTRRRCNCSQKVAESREVGWCRPGSGLQWKCGH
jgi:hypothetical protein